MYPERHHRGVLPRVLFFAVLLGLLIFAGQADAQDNRRSKNGRGKAEAGPAESGKASKRKSRRVKQNVFLKSPSPRPSGDRVTAPLPGTRRAQPRPSTGDRPDPARRSIISNPSSAPESRNRPARANVSVTGRRLPPRRPQTRASQIYNQRGPMVNNSRTSPDRSERMSPIRLPSSGLGNRQGPVGPRLARQGMDYTRRLPESRSSNYQPNLQRRLFVNNPSAQPSRRESKASQMANSGFVSGSTPFMKRLRRDPYWGKITPDRSRKETDLAGRPLRRRDYRSVVNSNPAGDSVRNAPRRVDRRPTSSAEIKKGFRSATETGRAWIGDISGRRMGSPRASAAQGQGQALPSGGQSARIRGQQRSASIEAAFGSARRQAGMFGGRPGRGVAGNFMRQSRAGISGQSNRKSGNFSAYSGSAALPSGIIGNIDLRFRRANTNRMPRQGRRGFSGNGAFGGFSGGSLSPLSARARGKGPGGAASGFRGTSNYRKNVAGNFEPFRAGSTLPSGLVGKVDLRVKRANPEKTGRNRNGSNPRVGGTGIKNLFAGRAATAPDLSVPKAGGFKSFQAGSTLPSGFTGIVDLRVRRSNPERISRSRTSGFSRSTGPGSYSGNQKSGGGGRVRAEGLLNGFTARGSNRPDLSVPKSGEFKPFRAGSTLPSGFTGIVDLRVRRSSPERVGQSRPSALAQTRGYEVRGSLPAFRRSTAPGSFSGNQKSGGRKRVNGSGLVNRQTGRKATRPDLSVPKAGEFKSFRAGSTLPSGLTGIVDMRVRRSSPDRVGRSRVTRNAGFKGMEVRGTLPAFRPSRTPGMFAGNVKAGARNRAAARGLVNGQPGRKASRPDLSVPKAGEFKSFKAGSTLPSGLTGIVDMRVRRSSPDRVGRSRVTRNAGLKGMEVRGTLPAFRPSRAPGMFAGNDRAGGRNRIDAGGLVNRQPARKAARPDLSVPKAGEFKSFKAGSTLPSGLTGIVDMRVRRSSPENSGRYRQTSSRQTRQFNVRGQLPSFPRSNDIGRFQGNLRAGDKRINVGGVVNGLTGRKAARPDLSVPKAGEFKAFKAGSTLPSGLTGIVDIRVRRSDPGKSGRYRIAGNRQTRQFEVRGQVPVFPRNKDIGKFQGNLKPGGSPADVGGIVNRQPERSSGRPVFRFSGDTRPVASGNPDRVGRYRLPSDRQTRQFEVRGQVPVFPRNKDIGKYQGNLKPGGSPADVGGIVNRQPERSSGRPVFRFSGDARPVASGNPDRVGRYRLPSDRQTRQFEVRGQVPMFPRNKDIGKYQGNLKPGGSPVDVGGVVNRLAGRRSSQPDFSVPKAGEFKAFKAGSTLPSGLTGIVDLRISRSNPDRAGRYRKPADLRIKRYEVKGNLPELNRNRDVGKFSGDVPLNTGRILRIIKGIDAAGNYSGTDRMRRAAYANVGGVVNRQRAYSETAGGRSIENAGQSFQRSQAPGNMARIASFQGTQPVVKPGSGQFHTPTFVKLMRGDFRNGLVRERNGNREDRIIAGYADKEMRNPFRGDWVSGPNTVPGALRKRRPDPDLFLVSGLKATIRYPENLRRRMDEQALRNARVTASAKEKPGSREQVPAKDYVTSPAGTKGALKVEEPNRSMIRSGMIQADFSHQSRQASGNGKGASGIRQLWNRFFGKAEGGNGNGKGQKPKYDPKEIGLWYD